MEHQQQHHHQEMEALKRVYADIILNTNKEAAARIMVCERKAALFQRSAASAKQEALQILVRLKQVMDSKISEVEMTSLRQKLKIEELEAQLNEAEDVVTDLRAQLNEVQNELENMKKAQGRLLNAQTATNSAASHENECHTDTLCTSEGFSVPLPDAGFQLEDSSFDDSKAGGNCCFTSKVATKSTKAPDKCIVENVCASNPDLASILMTTKKPEFYRNRRTQRVRAFKQNLFDPQLLLPGQYDDNDSDIKMKPTIKVDETAEVACTVVSVGELNAGLVEKKPVGLVASLGKNIRSNKCQDAKFTRRVSSRKSKSRYKNSVVVPCGNQVIPCATPMYSNVYQSPGNSLAESGEGLSRITEEEVPKNLEIHMHPGSTLHKTNTQHLLESMHGTENKTEMTGAVSVKKPISEDEATVDKAELSRQLGDGADGLGVANCEMNHKVPMTSTSKYINTGNCNNESIAQTVNDRLLKYAFQRKRKKGSLSCCDESDCQEKSSLKKRSGGKQSGAQDSHKSSSIIESSRDSRRLVQVARQLLSLSGKRR